LKRGKGKGFERLGGGELFWVLHTTLKKSKGFGNVRNRRNDVAGFLARVALVETCRRDQGQGNKREHITRSRGGVFRSNGSNASGSLYLLREEKRGVNKLKKKKAGGEGKATHVKREAGTVAHTMKQGQAVWLSDLREVEAQTKSFIKKKS